MLGFYEHVFGQTKSPSMMVDPINVLFGVTVRA